MLCDRRHLRRDLRRLQEAAQRQRLSAPELERFESAVARSAQRVQARRQGLPVPTFPSKLPVVALRQDIADVIKRNQVVVLCGETGSGKTTQLPKICLSLGRGVSGLIGHTQPRRIAARSIAARIAEELGGEVGGPVGYKVRFGDRVSPDSYVKVMTDGMLLAETQGDRLLEQYDTIILDEAHERSLNIDFLLGYLRHILPRRPDLKLIVTSATIDPVRFARHFWDAPVIDVSGRAYPVQVRYRPLEKTEEDTRDRDLQQALLEAVDEISRIGPGDILVFLPGEREIRETAEALRKHHPPRTQILPLYARLSTAEQERVFEPHVGRRIVLATNVAETSLTVPAIRFVVDPGYARISRYSHRTKVQRLLVEPVSRASADQRKGRCGRVTAGVCIRLYGEEDYALRPAYTDPEILRSNLAAVILQMKALGLGEPEAFPFLDMPDPRLVKDGYQTLRELGALEATGRLTDTGRRLARLPVDPRVGRMILSAEAEGCLAEVLVIAAALSIQDPRERPMDARPQADQAHARFRDERSDFLSFLKLWDDFAEQVRRLSNNKQRQYCREHFLSYVRMRDWSDVHKQLYGLVKDMGFQLNRTPAEYDAIHRALLPGLLGHVACRGEGTEYAAVRGARLAVFPGSALFKRGPKWIMAAEFVETTKLYARTAAAIQPEWVEQAAAHLVRRSYLEPHWEKSLAQAAAYERVTLYGLTLVARRKVHYGPIDPEAARSIFIRSALTQGEYRTRGPFFEHNRRLIEEIETMEAKSRRRNVLVDEEQVFRFYDRRIPRGIHSGALFERWRREAESGQPRLLFMTREDLMQHAAAEVTAEQFPDVIERGGIRFPLEYRFEPGDPADGVTACIPVAVLNQLDPAPFDWLVPGLLRDRVIALIRSLPKSLRRSFAPAPDFADACLQELAPGQAPLTEALAMALERMTGVNVPPDAWHPAVVPEHLKMNFRIVDLDGRDLALGRDLDVLRRGLGAEVQRSFRALPLGEFERSGITRWDFGDLPAELEVARHGLTVKAYPTLVDEGDAVALRLADSPFEASRQMRVGVRRLLLLHLPSQRRYLERNLPGIERMCIDYAALGTGAELKEDLVRAIVDRAFFADHPPPRSAEAFEQCSEKGRARLGGVADDTCAVVTDVLRLYRHVRGRLATDWRAYPEAAADVTRQLEHLVYPGFVTDTPDPWLQQLPRYLKAVDLRLDKLCVAPARDAQRLAELAPLWDAYLQRVQTHRLRGLVDTDLETYRWMLEELRVSFFAQELKTLLPVSLKRLQRQWERTRA